MSGHRTRVLGKADIERTMVLADYIEAVEDAFRRLGTGGMSVPGVVHIPAPDGAFHVKSAGFDGEPAYVAVKVNGNFPDNQRRHGLPTIQGAIVLCDGRNGSLLAIIDSIEITAMRTAAATAVAAKYLAPKDVSVATVIGCGLQGHVQMKFINEFLPIEKLYAFDIDRNRRDEFVAQMSDESTFEVVGVDMFESAALESQAIITCTSSRTPFLKREHVAPGTFIAAVGADNDDKQELHPDLMANATVVVDLIEQCAEIGDLHHALDAGVMTRQDVFAELADIVTGSTRSDFAEDEIVIFDSTGSAIQDVAAASMVYERASAADIGFSMQFA